MEGAGGGQSVGWLCFKYHIFSRHYPKCKNKHNCISLCSLHHKNLNYLVYVACTEFTICIFDIKSIPLICR